MNLCVGLALKEQFIRVDGTGGIGEQDKFEVGFDLLCGEGGGQEKGEDDVAHDGDVGRN